jgi:IS5 family transposase
MEAARPSDFAEVIVDTTVQEKAISFPTDARLMHRARERLVRLARAKGIKLRQSYWRLGKFALIKHQRYTHAKQFRRANKALRRIGTMLGRVIRDVQRKIADNPSLGEVFALPLSLARQVRDQRQRQRGKKIYSLHAPEVECIGKGKAHKPYEFGVKVSVATPVNRCKGGQFVAHVKALPGNPYDGHTLATIIPDIEISIGASLTKIVADAGYRGHNAPKDKQFKVYVAGQKRGLSAAIKRAFRRRSAVEPVIGHLKNEHRMNRNHLAGSRGDANNAVLAAAGYNFRLLLLWLSILRACLNAIVRSIPQTSITLQAT